MKSYAFLAFAAAAVLLAGCSEPAQQSQTAAPKPAPESQPALAPIDVPAGAYKTDPAHSSLIFRLSHLGFSNYTARFKKFAAELTFDPANPAASSVSATIDAASIETDYPDPATLDFNGVLRGKDWLDTEQFPQITFRSTKVELTGPRSAKVSGDLTLHGVTRPATLDITFNGGYAGHPMDPSARIGFSARGTFKRSEFGMGYGIPAPGTTMGVGDAVEVIIESEFNGPPLAKAAQN